jgi:hypothetical protein
MMPPQGPPYGQPPRPPYGQQGGYVPQPYTPNQGPQQPPGVDVKVSYAARIGCASAIGGTIVLLSIASLIYSFVFADSSVSAVPGAGSSGSPDFNPAMLAFPVLGLVFFIIPLVLLTEKARIPARIDASGVTMRNGKKHAWQEYRGPRVLTLRTRSGSTYEKGVELMFASGSAMVTYRPITNLAEVRPVLQALKQGRRPW